MAFNDPDLLSLIYLQSYYQDLFELNKIVTFLYLYCVTGEKELLSPESIEH